MSETTQYTQIELLTLKGPEYRRVSTAPPRSPTEDEIPVIDLTAINGTPQKRKDLASKIRAAAQNTGFFYVSNHGIPEEVIQNALAQAKAFFGQSEEDKRRVSHEKLKGHDGFYGVGTTQINKSETKDRKETLSLRYNPENDPTVSDPTALNDERYGAQELLWTETSHLPGFREVTIDFWQRRLALARRMTRIFALTLDLPEDYFDEIITHPGADGLYIHYPGTPSIEAKTQGNIDIDAGIGSHTDIQCFTLLWQDMSGGLQVLSADDEWLDARPIEGTFVVNIGDFLQRLSNNRFKSTVHRVYNRRSTSRYAMPFFVGFNPEAVCEVAPTCVDDEHPALFEPISCGKWHRDRLELARGRAAAA
ncbi:2OG-Fe(II) oxygenase superfamily protein [Aspergillus steynii IBT 23096]|uniref:2OG-Fe(II) oxygenase superfamily protein n=1 Tax=Aspergillus steynii IBT 23096 TaxID=1392250 RepID=A0A2I2GLZ6_9EURO|nr:2OG-Fe(II) oxygenase superfamily protein [Aspergillus steynii IBT 23096]PLB53879.1 2OG-Fe(II) oxygenase superfamily protein [Aspergillus steynii IBT 23096]